MTVEQTPLECQRSLENRPDLLILDVRSPKEYELGHLPRAMNLPSSLPQLQSQLDALDKSRAYLIYCQSGIHSLRIIRYLEYNGFTQIYHLTRGIAAWVRAGLPLNKEEK